MNGVVHLACQTGALHSTLLRGDAEGGQREALRIRLGGAVSDMHSPPSGDDRFLSYIATISFNTGCCDNAHTSF